MPAVLMILGVAVASAGCSGGGGGSLSARDDDSLSTGGTDLGTDGDTGGDTGLGTDGGTGGDTGLGTDGGTGGDTGLGTDGGTGGDTGLGTDGGTTSGSDGGTDGDTGGTSGQTASGASIALLQFLETGNRRDGAGDFVWICDASGRAAENVGYVFESEGNYAVTRGEWASNIDLENETLDDYGEFTVIGGTGDSLLLDYAADGIQEDISSIQIDGSARWTGFSSTDGNLDCELYNDPDGVGVDPDVRAEKVFGSLKLETTADTRSPNDSSKLRR